MNDLLSMLLILDICLESFLVGYLSAEISEGEK